MPPEQGRGVLVLGIGHLCAGEVTRESGATVNPVNGPACLRDVRRLVLPLRNENGGHSNEQRENDRRADPIKRWSRRRSSRRCGDPDAMRN